MMCEVVKCNLCYLEKDINQVYSCLNSGNRTYECVDEKLCKILREKMKKKMREEEEKKFLKNLNIEINDVNEEELRELTQEEKFYRKFNLNFDDLIEVPQRFRDASIHYYHKEKDIFFTWSLTRKVWSICNKRFQTALEEHS